MDLTARLDGYEVTSVPVRRARRLQLVWSAVPDDESVIVDVDSPLALALLDDYRITRVPVAS